MAEKKLTYKGKPLVRKGDEIYYGGPDDPYVLYLNILSHKEENGEQVPDKVQVRLVSMDASIPFAQRILKTSEKSGIWGALEIGSVWLERAIAEQK